MKKLVVGAITFISSICIAVPIKVAVIDSGLDQNNLLNKVKLCPGLSKDFTTDNDPFLDKQGHGTHVSGLIKDNAKDAEYCEIMIKFWTPHEFGHDEQSNITKSILYAIKIKANIINISAGGTDPNAEEQAAIEQALDAGIVIVAAAGNEWSDLRLFPYYPACYDSRLIVVEALTEDGSKRYEHSNYLGTSKGVLINRCNLNRTDKEIGENVDVRSTTFRKMRMTGTSQATAIHTGKILNRFYTRIMVEKLTKKVKRGTKRDR